MPPLGLYAGLYEGLYGGVYLFATAHTLLGLGFYLAFINIYLVFLMGRAGGMGGGYDIRICRHTQIRFLRMDSLIES